MATAELPGILAVSRAVVSAAAELVAGVERAMAGDGKVRTARGNAWDALEADRARARQRAETGALIAGLSRTPTPPRDLGVVVGASRAISR
jgi:hypothetical protein